MTCSLPASFLAMRILSLPWLVGRMAGTVMVMPELLLMGDFLQKYLNSRVEISNKKVTKSYYFNDI